MPPIMESRYIGWKLSALLKRLNQGTTTFHLLSNPVTILTLCSGIPPLPSKMGQAQLKRQQREMFFCSFCPVYKIDLGSKICFVLVEKMPSKAQLYVFISTIQENTARFLCCIFRVRVNTVSVSSEYVQMLSAYLEMILYTASSQDLTQY